ncbi:MAG TPA: hypothetical protein VK638_26625, partial [Edaphobacter sp.]|nr:hypothetical protein [Edaphobacter sp.]
RRGYQHAIDEFVSWYCSEPRLAFNKTVVLRYRFYLEERGLINCVLVATPRIGEARLRGTAAFECSRSGMPSLVLGRFFLRLVPLVDVFLMMAALNAVDHEVKRVIAYYVCAMQSATW